jgi:Zn-dependent M28 family amino/carboxypeptidase
MLVLLAYIGCNNTPAPKATSNDLSEAIAAIKAETLEKHMSVLASDEFEGRGPGTPGEEKTVQYLKKEFAALGLKPGNGDSWFQEVPLIQITADPNTSLTLENNKGKRELAYSDDMIVWTKRVSEAVSLKDSEMVFVGYGIVAPEYGWNDYEGLDVKGKTVVMLVNDPGYATKDPNTFTGNAMTYYGRWTYKYEEAARQGAEAAFIIHQTAPASYPWEVVSGSWSGMQSDLVSADKNMSRCAVEGWLTEDQARQLFTEAGLDLATEQEQASQKGYKPKPLNTKASVDISNTIVESTSRNVLALLEGSTRPDEVIVYMGHWDHIGRDESLEGDQIYNGAVDNASGTAALLVLAEAYKKLPAPERSIVFLAVTAEEQGLLGSRHYTENPIYAANKSVAGINMDGLPFIGKTKDLEVVGFGQSELDKYLAEAAKTQNRVLVADGHPEAGYYYRSDHLNFAKIGVPAMFAASGTDSVEHGPEWGAEQAANYTRDHYHKPSDEMDPNWDMSGVIQDLELFFRVGHRIANSNDWPAWSEQSEFRAIREKSRAQAQ